MMRAKVPPAGEKLAKVLDRSKMFHVEHRFRTQKFEGPQRGQPDWGLPRGTLPSDVDVHQIAPRLPKGRNCVTQEGQKSLSHSDLPRGPFLPDQPLPNFSTA